MKKTVAGFLTGLSIALLLTLFAGENPLHILEILIKSSLGTTYDLGLTLSYVTPLIFTGLSVCLAFHGGLFNIGAEGQLTIAALTAAVTGIAFPRIPFPIAPIFAISMGAIAGGLWGLIPGWLKAYRGSHEVIVTIMMNFIAAGLTSWVTLKHFQNPESQNPETARISANYFTKNIDPISQFFADTPASSAFIWALICAAIVWIFLWRTKLGFELRAAGNNSSAAERAGISSKKMQVLAMGLAGVLASFVSYSEIIASVGQFKIGFSPDYGFLGIAVALLAANNPLAVVPAAFLMGALHKGASDLDMETVTITRDFSKILQALIILFVCAPAMWDLMKIKKRKDSPNGHL